MPARGHQHDVDRDLERRAPAGVDGQRARAAPRAQPSADALAVQNQRRAGAALVLRPLTLRQQRPVGDADRGHVGHRAELQREAGAAGMVARGGVDQQHVGRG